MHDGPLCDVYIYHAKIENILILKLALINISQSLAKFSQDTIQEGAGRGTFLLSILGNEIWQ
jgi:hypothetical protein